MNYCICTVVNDVYSEFLYYFTKSALEKCNGLETLHILYTGENLPTNEIFSNPKIKITKYSDIIVTKNLWDSGWVKNVDLKSKFLKDLANEYDIPIFLIDVDCYFIEEFISVIDKNVDLVICKRDHLSPFIASFVGLINPKKCIPFIDEWKKIMDSTSTVPKETSSLCTTIKNFRNKLKIQELHEHIINATNFKNLSKEAKIVHFKGRTLGDANKMLTERLNNLKIYYNV